MDAGFGIPCLRRLLKPRVRTLDSLDLFVAPAEPVQSLSTLPKTSGYLLLNLSSDLRATSKSLLEILGASDRLDGERQEICVGVVDG